MHEFSSFTHSKVAIATSKIILFELISATEVDFGYSHFPKTER